MDRREVLKGMMATSFVGGSIMGGGFGFSALPSPAKAMPFSEVAQNIPGFRLIENAPPVPPIPVQDLAGNTTRLDAFTGQVLLLNLWATWCGPCVAELPSLQRLQAMRGGKDFQVLAVATDRAGARKVKPFVKRLGLDDLLVLLEPTGDMMRAFGTNLLPTTLFVDRFGSILGGIQGATDWDTPPVIAALDNLIAA
ncbi:MAG: TlpA family protein disulfide reductase [Magnetovibrionaceae bacterium]